MRKVWLILAGLVIFAFPAFSQQISGQISTTGSTCVIPTNCVVLPLQINAASAAIVVSGTFTGTLQFEVSADGTNYTAVNAFPPNSTTAVTSSTGTGTWRAVVSGMLFVRVRASALASPSAIVSINATQGASAGFASSGGGGGSFTAAGDLSGTSSSQTVIGINGTLLSGLATGLPKITTGTGAVSIATAGTDYVVPSGSITGNAGTATALASTPTQCTTNFAQGVAASGNANCSSSVTGAITVGSLATNSNGVDASQISMVGNTANTACPANTWCLNGPPLALFTTWDMSVESTVPVTTDLFSATVSGAHAILHDSGIAATGTGFNTVVKTLTGCNTATFVYTPQAADCVAPGTGSVGGTATIGFLPKMVTNTSTITSSLVDEGITTANVLTVADTAGLAVPNGIITSGTGPAITAGTGGGEAATEGTAFTGVATSDGWYASTANSCVDVLNHTTDIGCAVGTTGTQTLSNKTLTAPNIGAATGTSLSVTGSLTSTVATGTAPLVITSTTTVPNLTLSNHPTEQFCGTTTTCSHTAETGPKIVFGSAPLVSGAPSTATVTGISPAFTATADYVCTVSAPGASAATALLGVTNVSASSFTITGPASVTTVISYICVGF